MEYAKFRAFYSENQGGISHTQFQIEETYTWSLFLSVLNFQIIENRVCEISRTLF